MEPQEEGSSPSTSNNFKVTSFIDLQFLNQFDLAKINFEKKMHAKSKLTCAYDRNFFSGCFRQCSCQ